MVSRLDFFVTGTDTNVGKTLVSAALIRSLASHGLKVAGMKPVAAGAELRDGKLWNEDVALLSGEANVSLPSHLIAPYLFKEAAAPHVAAALEDQHINPATIFTAFENIRAQTEAVIVEGVGGFCVPLTPQAGMADIAARGLRLAAWVVNQIDPAMPHQSANIEALRERLPAPCLGSLPWMSVPSAALAADKLDFSQLADWPK